MERLSPEVALLVPELGTEPTSLAERLMSQIVYGPERQGAPTLATTEVGRQQFARLTEMMKQEPHNVLAVIRCWNKTATELDTLFDHLNIMKASIPSLRGVFI